MTDRPGPAALQRLALATLSDHADAPDGIENLAHLATVDVGHTEGEVIHRENKLSLRRYEPETVTRETPILVVYALVNRPYVLDLQPDRSVLRRLLEAGFPVYVIEWGEPSVLDRSLTVADYVLRYLDGCVDAVRADAGVDEVHLLGYCMGGTLSLVYASRKQDRVRTLSLLATPVSLDGTGGLLERWATHVDPAVVVDARGNLPAEWLAVAFAMLDPIENTVGKYRTLLENLEDEAFVRTFARVERWIRDGVDVAGETYREFVEEIYRANALIEGTYELDGEPVDLSGIEVPVLQVVGEDDTIVPPAASAPLHDAIASDDDRLIEFPAGHVGLSVSSRAHANLWPAVCEWLAERDGPDPSPTDRPDRTSRRAQSDGEDATTAAASVGRVTDAAAASLDARESDPDVDPVGKSPEDAPVHSVHGIGPTYGGRLAAAGYDTVADLRRADPETLADVAGTTPSRVAGWLARLE